MTVARECIFSVDVEDWFHILDLPSTPTIDEWDSLPSHLEKNFTKLLDLFSETRVSVTCFFLGWVAQHFPHLVREASQRGHEIASHGYSHALVYQMTPREFYEDATRSKSILEDLIGRPVLGYRSAGFSLTKDTPWFFDYLIAAGYRYDSSLFPTSRGHGGMKTNHYAPYVIGRDSSRLIEFPITVTRVCGTPLCFFGGGYLRLFPYQVIKRMTIRVLNEHRPVVFYVHPREIDPDHPRLPMGIARRFKSYANLRTTAPKLLRILAEFKITTFQRFIAANPLLGGQ